MDKKEMLALVPQAIEQVRAGAFLTAGREVWNPMTIGWVQFGEIWGRPIATVLVRKTRYTYELMENTDAFTISVPETGDMAKALAFCGTHSGRDVNKGERTGLTRLPSRTGGADGVACCRAYFECRIVHKVFCDLTHMDEEIRRQFYGDNQLGTDGNPHEMYFGEIIAAYRS